MTHAKSSRDKLVSLQFLRALASIVVVAWHSGYSYTFIGQAGVDLFFVISGFVMMLFSKREKSPWRFCMARLVRIVPLYWLVTLIAASVASSSAKALISSLLFWPDRPFPIVAQGWSLSLEIFYYILFALTLLAPQRIRLLLLATSVAMICFLIPAICFDNVTARAFANPMAFEFLSGACLFELWERNRLPLGTSAWFLGGVSVACLGATHFIGGAPNGWMRVALWGGPCLAIVAAGLGIEQSQKLPRLTLLKSLGDASYSIYLIHILILRPVGAILSPLWAPVALALAITWACAAGWLMYVMIERPLRGLSSHFIQWAGSSSGRSVARLTYDFPSRS